MDSIEKAIKSITCLLVGVLGSQVSRLVGFFCDEGALKYSSGIFFVLLGTSISVKVINLTRKKLEALD